jgi:hypothetical protein
LRPGIDHLAFLIAMQTAPLAFIFDEECKLINTDGFAKSPPSSLRGAKRRGNLLEIRGVMRLLRFARNDKSALFGLFTSSSNEQ